MEMQVFLDAHAHLYPNHDTDRWLQSLVQNVHAIVPHVNTAAAFITESDNEGSWQRLVENPEHAWPITRCEDGSAWLTNPDTTAPVTTLLLVRGRQLVTAERLEVLAVMGDLEAIDAADPGSMELSELIQCVDQHGGLAIVPWGFGKWSGSRGKRVQAWLDTRTRAHGNGWLADSGGRPSWLSSKFISQWFDHEFVDIAGSDPLRLNGHETNVARCGIEVQIDIDLYSNAHPGQALIGFITKLNNRSVHYRFLARRPGVFQFVRDQVALRIT